MKVTSKIISGFLILMLLAVVVLAYELTVIRQLKAVNHDFSEIDMSAASTALDAEKLAEIMVKNSERFFAVEEHDEYYEHLTEERGYFIEDLRTLRRTSRFDAERAAVLKLQEAFDQYWLAFNAVREQNKTWDPEDLPPTLTIAMEHLESQSEATYQAVRGAMKEQVIAAAGTGDKAEKLYWSAAAFSLLLGVIVAAFTVRSINDPLHRLTNGTRAIAKGQFWHRLPAHGNDEFAELARDFNSMTEKLGELDQMKKDFVSHVSHDLKAPLASIRQIMHLLLQKIPGPLNEQQQGLIRLSYNSAERLAAMVGNLLDVSRMEAGTMEYQMAPNDVVSLAKAVNEEFDVQAHEKGIRLRVECDEPAVFADCDRNRIVQVVGNLLENALKFSPSSSDIVTRIRRGKAGEIVIAVSDSGPGVPDGHKEQIFRKFHQLSHGKKAAGQGVGLGLAICKTIVHAHRGDIWVDDNPGGGSTFSFILQSSAKEETLKCGQPA
jgi:two-component system sensor histidine kinase GlrK